MNDNIFSSFNNGRIAVIGDLMLDVYLWGQVSRISPDTRLEFRSVSKTEFVISRILVTVIIAYFSCFVNPSPSLTPKHRKRTGDLPSFCYHFVFFLSTS